ncbi:hypothetical protein ACTXT7_002145 [Hymenolepis weldensis]
MSASDKTSLSLLGMSQNDVIRMVKYFAWHCSEAMRQCPLQWYRFYLLESSLIFGNGVVYCELFKVGLRLMILSLVNLDMRATKNSVLQKVGVQKPAKTMPCAHFTDLQADSLVVAADSKEYLKKGEKPEKAVDKHFEKD